MNSETNLIYALYCPINNNPVYIGKSTVGVDRPFCHIKERSHNLKVNQWVNRLKQRGLQPIIVILESNFDLKYIDSKEEYWVHKFINDGNILLNQTLISSLYFESFEFNGKINKNDFLLDIRLYIKARRKLLKLTQYELSKKSGLGLRFIREIEQGSKTNFNTDAIQKVLLCLGKVRLTIIESE